MAKIKAFKALVYNQQKIKDLSTVVCPPYDVLSKQQQEMYHSRSPYNLLNVDLRAEKPGEDTYAAAGRTLRSWIEEGILLRDEKPAIYFYSHEYSIKREKKIRFGFLALLRLDDKKNSVFGHEHTHSEAKEDRLKLIRQTKANTSPIFVIFSDKKRIIPWLAEKYSVSKKPFIEIVDDEQGIHKLWRVDEPALLEKITQQMDKENMFIADGHHRYEVSGIYRDEAEKSNPCAKDADPDHNYLMAYFTNSDSPGLTILPIHRLVRLAAVPDMEKLSQQLNEHFSVEEVKDPVRFFFLLAKAGQAEHVIGVYHNRRNWLLRLRNVKVLDKLISDKPPEYRSLDVSILNTLIFKNILNINIEDKSVLTYIHDRDELISRADRDDRCIAFVLNPTQVNQIVSVALKGEKMPPKSTFFYPKVISGVVINKFEES